VPLPTRGYAVKEAQAPLEPFDFTRRDLGAQDVLIDILYCGVCHSDIHQARNEWGNSIYPMVPGHEIIGRVVRVGSSATRFREGETVGVGVFVDSCRECRNCREGLEQYCERGFVPTYNGYERDGLTPTYGGYSTQIVVDETYVYNIPGGLSLPGAAPLLCAGITTYSPLRYFGAGAGQRVGVVGLGGLGHMGVKFAASFGAEVTVFSTSPTKERDARRLGAHHFVVTREAQNLAPLANSFDLILDTVSAPHDINALLNLLRRDGVLVQVGLPEKPFEVDPFSLPAARRKLAGSNIGSLRETQEMLDYCGAKGIEADVEVIPIQKINEAYERALRGEVRYRFVIDMASLKAETAL